MIDPQKLLRLCVKNDLNFFTGVPCSIFTDFLIHINDIRGKIQHVRATSEGEAVAIAAGYHLSTRKVPVVYMQNSGLGNAVNPLTSLMDEKVYGIPALLFITWRGEPGEPDEPQHIKMGSITLELLKTLGIFYEIADENPERLALQLLGLKKKTEASNRPVAMVFKKKVISKSIPSKTLKREALRMTREEAITALLKKAGSLPLIATTGKTSREVFEVRKKLGQPHESDFLTVGSMGCSSGIALGLSLNTESPVLILDGDGAILMKMGTLATIGKYAPTNLIHVIIDNNSYESTGSQPTVSDVLNWKELFSATGYKGSLLIKDLDDIEKINFNSITGPYAIIIKTISVSRIDLGRPSDLPSESKNNFMQFLNKLKHENRKYK